MPIRPGSIGCVGNDLVRSATGTARLTCEDLEVLDQRSKALLVTSLARGEQVAQGPTLTVYPHVELSRESAPATP
jgi:hypothetical protein